MSNATVRFLVEIRIEFGGLGESEEVGILMKHLGVLGWCKFISQKYLHGIKVNEILTQFASYVRKYSDLHESDPVFKRIEIIWKDGVNTGNAEDIVKVIFFIHPQSLVKTRSVEEVE